MLSSYYLLLLIVETDWYTPQGICSLHSLLTYFFVLFPNWEHKVVIETLSLSCAEDRPEDVYNLKTLQTLVFYCLSLCSLVLV